MLMIHCCHPPNTSGTEPTGKSSENTTSCGAGTVSKVNEVTTPKFPPPPPRNAQNKSGSTDADTVRDVPSAGTTGADTSRSQVNPYLRDSMPIPPPSVRPAIPTDGHVPAGRQRPTP